MEAQTDDDEGERQRDGRLLLKRCDVLCTCLRESMERGVNFGVRLHEAGRKTGNSDIAAPPLDLTALHEACGCALLAYATLLENRVRCDWRKNGFLQSGAEMKRAEASLVRSNLLIANSADACESLCSAWEEAFAVKDLAEARSRLLGVIHAAITPVFEVLVAPLHVCLSEISRRDWAVLGEVGGESEYVCAFAQALRKSMGDIKAVAPSSSQAHHHLSTRLVVALAKCVLDGIFDLPGTVSELGARQLQVDVATIKQTMQDTLVGAGQHRAVFSRGVQKQFGPSEASLKTLATPIDSTITAFLALLPNAHVADFARLLELKGVSAHDILRSIHAYEVLVPLTAQRPPLVTHSAQFPRLSAPYPKPGNDATPLVRLESPRHKQPTRSEPALLATSDFVAATMAKIAAVGNKHPFPSSSRRAESKKKATGPSDTKAKECHPSTFRLSAGPFTARTADINIMSISKFLNEDS
jgi:hypothetical protein